MRVMILLLFAIFFFRQIFGGEVWYCCDNLLINIPARKFQIEELRLGRFPLENPYIFSGTPFLADINLAALYPGNIIFFLFRNPFGALTIAIIYHFFVAFTGVYLVAKTLGLSRTARYVSAIVFTFSGTMVTYTNNLPMLQVAALLPWVFWAWVRLLARPTPIRVIVFATLASLQIFAGHAQFMYYTWALLLAWTIVHWPKKAVYVGWSVIFVTILTAVQTVPFFKFAQESTRSTFGYEYSVYDSLNPLAIIRLIIPWSVGILNQGTAWAMGGSVYGYVGVLPLILTLVAPRRKPVVRFFLIVALVSFITALGKYTPFYPLLYRIVPGLGSFRSPQHFLLIWTFAIAILAGYGSQKLARAKKLLVIAAAGMLSVAVFAVAIFGTHVFDPLFPAKLVSKFALDPALRPTIMRLIVLNTGLTAIIVSLFYKYRTGLAICVLIFSDLFIFTRSNIITESQSTVSSWFEVNDALVRSIEPDGKIFVHKDLYPAQYQKQFGKNQLPDEAAWQVAILRPNINMLYRIGSIDGYASIVSRTYQDSFGVPATDPTGINVGEVTGEKLISRSVNVVLAPPDQKYIRELYPLMLSEWTPRMAIYREARK